MYILAIDSASNQCAVSLWKDKQKCEGRALNMRQGHASNLGPLCRDVMVHANLKLSEIHTILVNVGPGSFTGIRVGIAFAQGLAYSASILLRGISAFDAALTNFDEKQSNYLIVLDARRHDYYCQLIAKGQKQDPQSLTKDEITLIVDQYNPILIGDGAKALGYKIRSNNCSNNADTLVSAYNRGVSIPAQAYYLRQPDVTIQTC